VNTKITDIDVYIYIKILLYINKMEILTSICETGGNIEIINSCLEQFKINSNKIAGIGATSLVFEACFEGKCDFVTKVMVLEKSSNNKGRVENYFGIKIDDIIREIEIGCVASKIGIGPNIYSVWICDDIKRYDLETPVTKEFFDRHARRSIAQLLNDIYVENSLHQPRTLTDQVEQLEEYYNQPYIGNLNLYGRAKNLWITVMGKEPPRINREYCFISLQKINGITLEDYINRNGITKLSKSFWKEVKRVIDIMHMNHIYHGDLHRGNVLIVETDDQPEIFIIDYGKSQFTDDERKFQNDFDTLIGISEESPFEYLGYDPFI
jgi:serine/threonine protein kinase